MGYFLMVKHAKSANLNLKYICKCMDNRNHLTYNGSGTHWRRAIRKHKPEITTEILGWYPTQSELAAAGAFYSEKFNVVESSDWANIIPETGAGGDTVGGRIRAHNVNNPTEERFFDKNEELPAGWIRGVIRPPKTPAAIESTRKYHTGRKRSEETRERMRNSSRKPRKTVACIHCGMHITPQNIYRHENIYCEKNEKSTKNSQVD